MKLDIFNWLVTFFCLLSDCEAAKILAIIPFRVDSHFPIFENLLKGLVARGHQVVAVSHYPQKNPIENFTDISLVGSLPSTKDNVSLGSIEAANSGLFISFFLGFATSACKIVYEHPQVKQLLERENEFDLVINEIWGNDCFLALTHKFKIPHIGIITSVAYPWSNDRVANPDNPSYIPNFFLPYSDRMSFYERLTNLVFTVGAKYLHYFMSERPTHQIASQHFSDLPPLSEIARTTSLIFVNSHFSINHPRPGFIEVAGLHIKDSKPLPQELLTYINQSEHGVIYFSFGTMIRPDSMSPERLKLFLEVFSNIPQRILWRCENDKMPQLPKNVRCYKWMPQRDILAHPNVLVFITHGGMMGTQEAVHTGVPMLGFPLFADQILNIQNYVSKGIAIKLEFSTFKKDDLINSLDKLLNDQRYKENAKLLSKLFRDRPLTPLETAIYWTEYVIRHNGANHLKCSAVDLYWYQYLLLDVVTVLLLVTFLLCSFVYIVFRKCFKFFTTSNLLAKKEK